MASSSPAEFEGREIHILGHFVRDDQPDLSVAATVALRRDRVVRARRDAASALRLGNERRPDRGSGRAVPRAPPWAVATWPSGWFERGRLPVIGRRSPIISVTKGLRTSPSPDWP